MKIYPPYDWRAGGGEKVPYAGGHCDQHPSSVVVSVTVIVPIVPLLQIDGLGLAVIGKDVTLNVTGVLLVAFKIGVVVMLLNTGVVTGTEVVDSAPVRGALPILPGIDELEDGGDGAPDPVGK